jgi:hypothetical protein
VRDVVLEEQKEAWGLLPIGEDALMLEKWSLEKRKALFQEVFGIALAIGYQ